MDTALSCDYHKVFQPRPLLGFCKAVQLIESETATDFDPNIIFPNGFEPGVRRALRYGSESGEEVADGLSNMGLGAHGSKGNDAALQRQCRQQLRDRLLLVRFLDRRALPQDQSCARCKGAYQMQWRGINTRAATSLAVDGDHRATAQTRNKRAGP